MTGFTTMTQKGQVTIPVDMRKKLGAKPYDTIRLEYENGFIKIKPVKDILDMAGMFKAPRGKSALKAREYMEKHYKRI